MNLRNPVFELTVVCPMRLAVGTPVMPADEQSRPELVVRAATFNEAAIGVVNSAPQALDHPVQGVHMHGMSVAGLAPGRAGAAFAAGVFLAVGPDGRLVEASSIDVPVRQIVAQAIERADREGQVVAVRLMACVARR